MKTKIVRSLRAEPRRGGALVLALMAVSVVSVLGAGFLQLTAATMRRQEFGIAQKQAFYVAEAGLAEAWAGLLVGKSGSVGSAAAPAVFGEGLFWVEATAQVDGTKSLRSTGMCRSGSATLEVLVEWPDALASAAAVFSEEALQIEPGSLVDGYDSALGEYDPLQAVPVLVQSNGAIRVLGEALEAATKIVGDLLTGPSSSASVSRHATLTGSSAPAGAPLVLPAVEPPAIALAPGIAHDTGVPLFLPGSTGLEFLHVAADSEVLVQGPATLVVGDLLVDPSGALSFDTTDGPIALYVTGSIALAPGSLVETSDFDATLVKLRVAGDVAVELGATGSFHGVVYAPEAEVDIAQGFELFGSVLARRLDLEAGARIHFDEAIRREVENAHLPRYLGWRVLELPELARVRTSSDPFRNLGISPVGLPRPSDAHADSMLEIQYDDGSGAASYTGPESGFDWNLVDTVVGIVRDGTRIL